MDIHDRFSDRTVPLELRERDPLYLLYHSGLSRATPPTLATPPNILVRPSESKSTGFTLSLSHGMIQTCC